VGKTEIGGFWPVQVVKLDKIELVHTREAPSGEKAKGMAE
jgi:hypothetical protein